MIARTYDACMAVRKMHDQSDEYLTPTEAARLLPRTAAESVRRWIREGRIPAIRLPGGRLMVRRSDIEEILTPKLASSPSASSADESGDGAQLPGQEVLPW